MLTGRYEMARKRSLLCVTHGNFPAIFITALWLGILPMPASAQQLEVEVQATQDRLETARSAALHLLAPRTFERAVSRLELARDRLARGDAIRDIRAALDQAAESLDQAERFGESGETIFRGVLEARTGALAAGAPRLVPRAWDEAERELMDGGRRFERGDRVMAEARAKTARPMYQTAELEAVRTSVLGAAREMREWAVAIEAFRSAPLTLAEADKLLAEANALLSEDRTRLSSAGRLGSSATSAYSRAGRIALMADSVRRRELTVETLVRRHEDEVATIARQLHFQPELASGISALVSEAVAAVRSLQEDRDNLTGQLAQRQQELAEAQSRFDSLQGLLGGLEQREARLAAELREKERGERRLRELRAIFTADEGEVLVRGDTLTIRLFGLTFETGSDEVRPEDFSLLTKLQHVLGEFPKARIVVEGHTDSRGNENSNRALSQRRAIAVREHILTNMPISSARITAVGHGEDRPIASNDTAEGREKNRRIEVVLDLSGS